MALEHFEIHGDAEESTRITPQEALSSLYSVLATQIIESGGGVVNSFESQEISGWGFKIEDGSAWLSDGLILESGGGDDYGLALINTPTTYLDKGEFYLKFGRLPKDVLIQPDLERLRSLVTSNSVGSGEYKTTRGEKSDHLSSRYQVTTEDNGERKSFQESRVYLRQDNLELESRNLASRLQDYEEIVLLGLVVR